MSTYKKVSTLLTLVCVMYMCFVSLLQLSLQTGTRPEKVTDQSLTGQAAVQQINEGLQAWASEEDNANMPSNILDPSKSDHTERAPLSEILNLQRGFLQKNEDSDASMKYFVEKLPSVRLRKLSEKSRHHTPPYDFQQGHRKESKRPKIKQVTTDNNPRMVSESQVHFLPVASDVYIFGAYLDMRYADTIYARILTLRASVNLTMKILCRYSDLHNRSIDVMAEEYEMCENHDKKYGGWIYSCSLPGFVPTKSTTVISLRIITEDRKTSTTFTPIHLQPLDHNSYKNQHRQSAVPQNRDLFDPYHPNKTSDSVKIIKSNINSIPKNNTMQHAETQSNSTMGGDTRTTSSTLGVCVPPLYGDVYLSKLINFIEMCRLLGAHKIFLYIHDISEEIKTFLQNYRGLDPSILHLIDWNLPIIKKPSPSTSSPSLSPSTPSSSSVPFPQTTSSIANQIIWNHGQLLAVQHCMYTNMADYDWLLFMDTDEMLVPQSTSTWPELVKQVINHPHQEFHFNHIAGISFESAFFQQDFQTQVTNSIEYFQYLHRTRKTSQFRSKLLIQPSKAFELGIHHLSKPIQDNMKVIKARTDQGLLHHYRKCVMDEGEDDIQCQILIKDETILKYEVPLTIASREVTKAAMDFFTKKL